MSVPNTSNDNPPPWNLHMRNKYTVNGINEEGDIARIKLAITILNKFW